MTIGIIDYLRVKRRPLAGSCDHYRPNYPIKDKIVNLSESHYKQLSASRKQLIQNMKLHACNAVMLKIMIHCLSYYHKQNFEWDRQLLVVLDA